QNLPLGRLLRWQVGDLQFSGAAGDRPYAITASQAGLVRRYASSGGRCSRISAGINPIFARRLTGHRPLAARMLRTLADANG
ncbi:MAG: hypothetical protein ACRDNK_06335, partial [Solirubrobacteraceae bacterium]